MREWPGNTGFSRTGLSLWTAVSPKQSPKSQKVSGLFREYSRFGEIIGRDKGLIGHCHRSRHSMCAGSESLGSAGTIGRAEPSLSAATGPPMEIDTYSRSKRADYADLADTVAAILRAAIAAHPTPFRLQLVQARAKDPDSLRKKLEDRGLLATTTWRRT